MVKSAKRKAPPSRIKYEQGHPVVSFRVPKEVYNELQQIKEAGEKSLTDILMLGFSRLQCS